MDLATLQQQYDTVPRPMDARLAELQKQLTSLPIVPVVLIVLGALSLLGSVQWWFLFGIFSAGTIVSLALVAGGTFAYVRMRSTQRSELAQDLADGTLVAAVVVEAHPELHTPGFHNLPARLVYSLDPGRRLDVAYLEWLATGVRSLKGAPAPAPDLVEIWKHINDPSAYGARVFPASTAGNTQSFLAVMSIKTRSLPEHRLSSSVIPCLYLPRRAQLAIL